MTIPQSALHQDRQTGPWSVDAAGGLWSDWLALTDSRHLVATARDPEQQAAFAARLHQTAASIPDAQVLMIHGNGIHSADDLLGQLRLQLPGALSSVVIPDGERAHDIDSTGDLNAPHPAHARVLRRIRDVLSSRVVPEGWRGPRFRYFFWHQADVLLKRDPALFGELVDMALGVAAECDFGHSNHLMIQRWVFLGTPALDVYAEDGRGQFKTWLADSPGVCRVSCRRDDATGGGTDGVDDADTRAPCFVDWSAATGCLFPQVRRVRIDALMTATHAG